MREWDRLAEHAKWDKALVSAELVRLEERRAALEKIARENEGKVVAVVSHGVTIRCLLSHILGKPLDDPTLPICGNTGVTHLFFEDGRYSVDYINDCAHLAMLDLPEWDRTPNLRAEPFSPAPAMPTRGKTPTARWRAFRPRPILPRPRAITAPTRAACCAFSRATKAPVCSI